VTLVDDLQPARFPLDNIGGREGREERCAILLPGLIHTTQHDPMSTETRSSEVQEVYPGGERRIIVLGTDGMELKGRRVWDAPGHQSRHCRQTFSHLDARISRKFLQMGMKTSATQPSLEISR